MSIMLTDLSGYDSHLHLDLIDQGRGSFNFDLNHCKRPQKIESYNRSIEKK
jgi:hypothetical protein